MTILLIILLWCAVSVALALGWSLWRRSMPSHPIDHECPQCRRLTLEQRPPTIHCPCCGWVED